MLLPARGAMMLTALCSGFTPPTLALVLARIPPSTHSLPPTAHSRPAAAPAMRSRPIGAAS
eukprot:3282286-Rhodomonas_salina.3